MTESEGSVRDATPPIFVLTGPPGAGKSTIAGALMRHFSYGLHIPVDDLREWVVSGLAGPVPEWTEETSRQFDLARRGAADLAARYADAGFAVAVDDVATLAQASQYFVEGLAPRRVVPVLLLPALDVALGRNARRTNKPFEPDFLVDTIQFLHTEFASQAANAVGWVVLDTSGQSPEETAAAIMHLAGASAER
jgi:adenylylsulfate kinase-like enzyme